MAIVDQTLSVRILEERLARTDNPRHRLLLGTVLEHLELGQGDIADVAGHEGVEGLGLGGGRRDLPTVRPPSPPASRVRHH